MTDKIIKYFKYGLRKKLKRPNCGRYLSLWDDKRWNRNKSFSNISYVNSNEFLYFLYQTKHDLCCVNDNNGQIIYNAIDKFFYLLFDFESYFNVFISNNIYKDRTEIINDIINFNQFNCLPYRLHNKYKFVELFRDLVKNSTSGIIGKE